MNSYFLVLSSLCVYQIETKSSECFLFNFFVGIIFGLCILARLDNAVLILFFMTHLFYKKRLTWAHLAGALLFCAPYFWMNINYFGGLMPISGKLKRLVCGYYLKKRLLRVR